MTEALTPPPEHVGERWHLIEFPFGQGFEPKEWDGHHWLHIRMKVSPESAARAGWRYFGPRDPHATRIAELTGSVDALREVQAMLARSVNEKLGRIATLEAEIKRLSGGLIAIHEASPDVPASVLRGIAYDIALNCIDPETARYQITRRALTGESHDK